MQWRISIPPLTRVLLALLLVFSISYQALRLRGDRTSGHYLALIPQWALFTPWVYFTATYSEQNLVTILIAGATILYGGKYLERAWGSLEFGKFILIVTLLPNLVASLIYVLLFAGAFLVAFKQLVPEHTVTILKGAVKIRVKHFPSIFLAANTLSGIILGTDTALVLAWVGFLTSWTYLRFYKNQLDLSSANTGGSELRGDASETFAFAYFWPDAMQPPIAAMADGIYNALVALRVSTAFSANDVEMGNEQATARGEDGLPSLLNQGGSRNGRSKQEEAELQISFLSVNHFDATTLPQLRAKTIQRHQTYQASTMADNSNPGNFANRPKEEVQAAASKGGQSSAGGFASMDPDKQKEIASQGGKASSGSFEPGSEKAKEAGLVLSAVEDTLQDQNHNATPTAYFAALLALLGQSIIPSDRVVNKELAFSAVYLLDLVTSHVPAALLRSKFSQILTSLGPTLTSEDAEAPLLRSSIGCLESLLLAQDSTAWALSQTQISPRRAVAGLLTLASDHRPKVRKRAQDAITQVLKHPPPSPSLDHPVADMCAETALKTLSNTLASSGPKNRKDRDRTQEQHQPGLLHALQLVKTVASASGGWPSKKIEPLCEVLMSVSRSNNEYLAMAAFEVFEILFTGMADQFSSTKLPRLMEVVSELKPSQNDSQLLPPWIAVISRGYDVSAQISPEETFRKLPTLFQMVSEYLSSASHDIRVSASECLISFLVNCVPDSIVAVPSILEQKILERLARAAEDLLSVKYQAAWMEVFHVQSAFFEALRWRAIPLARNIVTAIGGLRASESFNGKKEADAVLAKAIESMGPEAVLEILPLNLRTSQKGQPGRAWLLPLLRENVINANLAHFRSEFVPLSEAMYQRVIDHGASEKTMEVKIFETIVQQTWALFPGYCNLPLDLDEAFNQDFAELLSNLLYSQPELRADICRGLQTLVESNQEILAVEAGDEEIQVRSRITKSIAQANLEHLATFAGNLLAVLFNVYSQTLPQYRGYILQCINAYLSITKEKEILETFTRVAEMLEPALAEIISQPQPPKQQPKEASPNKMPPTSHTLMDLIVTLSVYLPLPTYPQLFALISSILPLTQDPQLQKKAYKLFPRLATSPNGAIALQTRNQDLQSLLLSSASSTSAPARRDRLLALAATIAHLPPTDLHFIPSVLSEVVISAKEVNEKARSAAFDLLVLMGRKMSEGGTIEQAKIPHMGPSAPKAEASLEEFFTMMSAGLVGSTPHVVSASITALTRVLYEFHSSLNPTVIEDLVSTLDLFLTSNNREIVRSCLGFTKVAIVTLPEEIVRPRLKSLIPGLMSWSKEHKSRFRAKVKHILERAVRRFGFEAVERCSPEDGKKLIQNIRKAKERKKRKRTEAAAAGENGEDEEMDDRKKKGRFESEYDEAIYGSEDDDTDSAASDEEGNISQAKSKGSNVRKDSGRGTYIVEDPDEPLDLLSRSALGRISTSKPIPLKPRSKTKAKVDLDGKLVFGPSNGADEDAMVVEGANEVDIEPGDGTLEGGINAYVEAIRGRDAVQRGRGGRLKFSNKRQRGGDKMDVDMEGEREKEVRRERRGRGRGRGRGVGMGVKGGKVSGSGNGVVKKRVDFKSQRRGLGVQKGRGGGMGKR
ncbi:MAG: hypothetical protein Q9208_005708 [Pyrenodesmia sp. 3 TL-2023]